MFISQGRGGSSIRSCRLAVSCPVCSYSHTHTLTTPLTITPVERKNYTYIPMKLRLQSKNAGYVATGMCAGEEKMYTMGLLPEYEMRKYYPTEERVRIRDRRAALDRDVREVRKVIETIGKVKTTRAWTGEASFRLGGSRRHSDPLFHLGAYELSRKSGCSSTHPITHRIAFP
jgi:hypothetical protein